MTPTPISNERLADMLGSWLAAHGTPALIESWNDFYARELQSLRSSPSCGSGVKRLEWVENGPGEWGAASLLGHYEIFEEDGFFCAYEPQGHIEDFKGLEEAKAAAQVHFETAIRSELEPAEDEPVAMTTEEIRLEDLKQMAAYSGPIVSFDWREPYYLASCDKCGWVGSSEHCGTDSFGDDSDVYCPRCHASGADCGKVAEALVRPASLEITEEMVERAIERWFLAEDISDCTDEMKAEWRSDMCATLQAALGGKL